MFFVCLLLAVIVNVVTVAVLIEGRTHSTCIIYQYFFIYLLSRGLIATRSA